MAATGFGAKAVNHSWCIWRSFKLKDDKLWKSLTKMIMYDLSE